MSRRRFPRRNLHGPGNRVFTLARTPEQTHSQPGFGAIRLDSLTAISPHQVIKNIVYSILLAYSPATNLVFIED